MFNLKNVVLTGKTSNSMPLALLTIVGGIAFLGAFVWFNMLSVTSALSYATGMTKTWAIVLFLALTFKVSTNNRSYQLLPEFIRYKLFLILNVLGFAWAVFCSDWPTYQVAFLGIALVVLYYNEIIVTKNP